MLDDAEGKQAHLFFNPSCFNKTGDAEKNLKNVCKAVTNGVEVDFETLDRFRKEAAQDEKCEANFRSDHQNYDVLLRVDANDGVQNPLDHPRTQKNDLHEPRVPVEAAQKDVPQGDEETLDDQEQISAGFQRVGSRHFFGSQKVSDFPDQFQENVDEDQARNPKVPKLEQVQRSHSREKQFGSEDEVGDDLDLQGHHQRAQNMDEVFQYASQLRDFDVDEQVGLDPQEEVSLECRECDGC